MFSIGFWEMALIALVALLVVGPKELPTLLRSVSSWMRRARDFAGEFRNELSREVDQAEELKRRIERETEIAELHKMLEDSRSTIPVDSPKEDKATPPGKEARDEASPPDETGGDSAKPAGGRDGRAP